MATVPVELFPPDTAWGEGVVVSGRLAYRADLREGRCPVWKAHCRSRLRSLAGGNRPAGGSAARRCDPLRALRRARQPQGGPGRFPPPERPRGGVCEQTGAFGEHREVLVAGGVRGLVLGVGDDAEPPYVRVPGLRPSTAGWSGEGDDQVHGEGEGVEPVPSACGGALEAHLPAPQPAARVEGVDAEPSRRRLPQHAWSPAAPRPPVPTGRSPSRRTLREHRPIAFGTRLDVLAGKRVSVPGKQAATRASLVLAKPRNACSLPLSALHVSTHC